MNAKTKTIIILFLGGLATTLLYNFSEGNTPNPQTILNYLFYTIIISLIWIAADKYFRFEVYYILYYIMLVYLYPHINNVIIFRRLFHNNRAARYDFIIYSYPKKFKEMVKKTNDGKKDNIIREIDNIERLPMGKHIPLVVKSKHLEKKKILPNWAFASLLIQPQINIGWNNEDGKHEVNIDMTEGNFNVGIYNTAGKLFMKYYHFRIGNKNRNNLLNLFEVSNNIVEFLKIITIKKIITH